MNYDVEHLGPRGAVRAIHDARPVLTLEDAHRILDKHRLGEPVSVEPLGPYVINFTHKIVRRAQPPLAFKGQYRSTANWSLCQEVEALHLLRDRSDLPVPEALVLDRDLDALQSPFLLTSWLDGQPSLPLFEAGGQEVRCHLARQLGRIVATIHSCPLAGDLHLPVVDLRHWRQIVMGNLFAHDGLHDALDRLAPDLESQVTSGLGAAREVAVRDEPWLTWADASLHNTVADTTAGGLPEICGTFDFQSAVISHGYADFLKPYAVLAGKSWRDESGSTPAWRAFEQGYGRVIDLRGPVYDASTCTNPAIQVRHWWEILGHLHRRTPDWLDELLVALVDLGT